MKYENLGVAKALDNAITQIETALSELREAQKRHQIDFEVRRAREGNPVIVVNNEVK